MMFLELTHSQGISIVQTNVSITSPLRETFRVMGLCSNLTSVEVLGQALGSPLEQIRLGALQTLNPLPLGSSKNCMPRSSGFLVNASGLDGIKFGNGLVRI